MKWWRSELHSSPVRGGGEEGAFTDAKVAKARLLRSKPTDAELHLWNALRLRQVDGAKFRRQRPVGKYFVDFVCLERALIVEVDGGQHFKEQRQYDAARDQWLGSRGYRVLRFSDRDVLTELDSVLDAIWVALAQRAGPPPSPSPADGGGDRPPNS
jgi:very-short-patch-repair endonuclease